MTSAIAVAVDGSTASTAPLARAIEVARATQRPLVGIFVIDSGWADFIGNDWQSSKGSRQGFLDYVQGKLEAQAEEARQQFEAAATGLSAARFAALVGDPTETLIGIIERGEAGLLIAGKETFRICGRPSIRDMPRLLAKRLGKRVLIV